MPSRHRERHPGRGNAARPETKGVAPANVKPDSTANWPSVPGKTQPKDRSGGTPKVRTRAKSEGV